MITEGHARARIECSSLAPPTPRAAYRVWISFGFFIRTATEATGELLTSKKENKTLWRMSSLMTWCLILGIACCVAAISNVEEAQIRVRRRVKPRPKKPLTLEELNYEVWCSTNHWLITILLKLLTISYVTSYRVWPLSGLTVTSELIIIQYNNIITIALF